jgi:hypothetical protein
MRKVGAAQATRLPSSRESFAIRGAVICFYDKLTPTYSHFDVKTVVGDFRTRMAIDDEIDAIKSQYPESQSNLALSLRLKLLSVLPGGSGLVVKLSEVLRFAD